MVDIGAITVTQAGDVGGIGQSKFWFQRVDATTPLVADCNAAAAAVHGLYNSVKGDLASTITWTFLGVVDLVDHATAAPQGVVALSSVPATVPGTAGGSYPGGVGGRLNWKTPSVHGRRYIRGCTFFTPMPAAEYTGSGALGSGVISDFNTAAAAYIAAMAAANLDPIIWHRPPKGTFSGGAVGLITAGIMSSTPASLRSRRVLRCVQRYSARSTVTVARRSLWHPHDRQLVLWILTPLESTGRATPRCTTTRFTPVLYPQCTIVSAAGPEDKACSSARSF